jgi:hypothetical protein
MPLETAQITPFLSRLYLFNAIDEERLAFIAARMEEVRLPPEQLVFEQAEESPHFYLIFSGRVQVTRYPRGSREEQMIGFLNPGDFFGQEVLEARQLRQVTVQTTTDVVLLRLDSGGLIEIAGHVPEIVPRLRLILDSYHLMLRTPLNWVDPEEYVHYLTRKHPLFLWLRLAPLIFISLLAAALLGGLYGVTPLTIFLLLLGGGLLVAGGVGLWLYVDWSNDYYIVTDKRVIYQERVVLLYDSRQESPMEQVQSTETDRSYLGQLVGFGDVRIRTYTGLILFKAVRQPKEVEAILQEQVKRIQSSLHQADLRAIEETIARRIGMLPTSQQSPKSETKLAPPSQLQRFLADMFHLRYEFGDTIQYRTHWWVLVRRIWFQTVVLLAIIGGSIMMLVQSTLGRLGHDFPVIGAFLGLCLAGLLIFLSWLYNYLDWHNDIYLITSEQVVDINRKPLGTEERRAAPIRNILSVEYKRVGIIGLVLNFGTVEIRVGDALFTFDDVFNPSEVQRELFHRIAMRNLRERQQQAESERQRMAEWIAAYDRLRGPGTRPGSPGPGAQGSGA